MELTLEAKERDINEKPSDLRKNGWIPGCIYGKKIEPKNIQVSLHKLKSYLSKHSSKVSLKIGKND